MAEIQTRRQEPAAENKEKGGTEIVMLARRVNKDTILMVNFPLNRDYDTNKTPARAQSLVFLSDLLTRLSCGQG